MATRDRLISLIAGGCFAGALTAWGQELSFLRPISVPGSLETTAAIAADGAAAYVAGMTRPPGSPYEFYTDAFLRKFDAAGSQLWERNFGGPVYLRAVAEAGSAIYVAGYTGWNLPAQVYYVLPGQTGSGFADAFLRRYDPDGNEVWTRQFGGEANDALSGLAVDATGVYVIGQFGAFAGPSQAFLGKFDSNGNELWTQKLVGALGLAADGAGVYVTGAQPTAVVSRYSPEGLLVWTQQFEFQAIPVSIVAGDGVYVSGGSFDSGDSFLRKYDSTGNVVWTKHSPTQSSNSLAVDESALYVGGTVTYTLPGQCAAGAEDAYVRAYSFDGTELWTRQFGSYYGETPNVIATAAGAVYIAGTQTSQELYPAVQRAYLAKLTPESAGTSPEPRIRAECVLNAANFVGGALAPGELVTILGERLGPPAAVAGGIGPDGRLPNSLADTRVLFNGMAAPLLSVSDSQIQTIVPLAIADQTTVGVQVEYKNTRSPIVTLAVLPSRPGVFSQDGSGAGQAAALNQDGTVNSPTNPAARGSIISLFATGLGITDPPLTEGALVTGSPPLLRGPVSVVFTNDGYLDDGVWGNVTYAGGAPGMLNGVAQINVQVPDEQYFTPGPWAPQIVAGNFWPHSFLAPISTIVTIR